MIYKRYLWALLLSIFLLPLGFRLAGFKELPLEGVTEPVKKPVFEINQWFEGEYQKRLEWFFSFNLGLRNASIRLANEIDYKLGVQRKYCIVGKHNELIGSEYISSYYGEDFIGKDSLQKAVNQISDFKNILNKNGVKFFVVLAPSKVRLHPEIIPEEFRRVGTDKTNYTQLKKALNTAQVPLLDFQEWLHELDRVSPFPVYSNLGVHWSNYAATICADTLMAYISKICNRVTNRIQFKGVEPQTEATDTDRDMLDLMNLICPIPLNRPLGKWQTELNVDTQKFLPSVLAVGDSYYWNIIYSGIQDKYFKPGSAYYYYNSIAYFNNGLTMPVKDINVLKVCLTKDVVFMLYTEPNLKNIGNGIAQQFNTAYLSSDTMNQLP